MIMHRFGNISRLLLTYSALVLGAVSAAAQQPSSHQAQAPSQPSHAQQAAHQALDMTLEKPESVGFSQERLERLHALMQKAVDQKQIAGIAKHANVVLDVKCDLKIIPPILASIAVLWQDGVIKKYSQPVEVCTQTVKHDDVWGDHEEVAREG